MSTLAEAISEAANGGDPTALFEAVKNLPSRPDEGIDPESDDDPGPIPGESFDDVTTAWIMGRLSDDVYERAIEEAS